MSAAVTEVIARYGSEMDLSFAMALNGGPQSRGEQDLQQVLQFPYSAMNGAENGRCQGAQDSGPRGFTLGKRIF